MKFESMRLLRALFACSPLMATATSAYAVNADWVGSQNNDWFESNNWVGGSLPGNNDTAQFTNDPGDYIASLGGGSDRVDRVEIGGDNAWTLRNGTMQLGAGGIDTQSQNIGSLEHTVGWVLDPLADSTFSIETNANLRLTGSISGTQTITKSGSGNLILDFGLPHTFDGVYSVESGELVVQSAGAIANETANYTLDGGTLRLNDAVNFSAAQAFTIGGGNAGIHVDTFSASIASDISGTGTLTKRGDGQITATGNATNAGGIVVDGGTFRIGDGGTTGSVSGDIENNASLVFDRSDAVVYGGVISGTGTIVKDGNSALTLTGFNTSTGLIQINSGDLRLGDGGLTGNTTADVNVETGGSLRFNRSSNLTYAGTITGSGGVIKNGTNTVTLSGESTHTGKITVTAGTLQVGDRGTAGSIASDVFNNATLIFHRSDNSTFSGNVTGTGNLIKRGEGRLSLGGDYFALGGITVQDGQLQIGVGGSTNTIDADIDNQSNVRFNTATSLTYSRVISGGGTLTKVGTGTLILDNANTFTGQTNITAGNIQLDAVDALANSTVVLSGGKLTLPIGVGTFQIGGISGNTFSNSRTARVGSNNEDTTLERLIGSGTLIKMGTGTLTITEGLSETSSIRIDEGAVQITQGSFEGRNSDIRWTQGSVSGSGTLIFDIENTLESDSVITGADLQVIKRGSKKLLLSPFPPNSFGGGLRIEEGTVEVSVDSPLGASGSTVTLAGGSLRYQISGDVTTNGLNQLIVEADQSTLRLGDFEETGGNLIYRNHILGTGSLILDLDDTASLKLTVNNQSHTGGMILDGGTLFVAHNNALGTGDLTVLGSTLRYDQGVSLNNNIDLQNNLTLRSADSGNATQSGIISEAGGSFGVEKTGAGQLTLVNTHTFTGKTTISAGTLRLGNGTANGNLSGDIDNNATLVFDSGTDQTFTGQISDGLSGSGAVIKRGPGRLTLDNNLNSWSGGLRLEAGEVVVDDTDKLGASNNPLTFDGGTLVIDTFSSSVLPGAGTLTIDDGGGTIHTDRNVDIDDDIVGTGQLTLTAPSNSFPEFTFSGTLDHSGGTRVLSDERVLFMNLDSAVVNSDIVTQTTGSTVLGRVFIQPDSDTVIHGNLDINTYTSLTLRHGVFQGDVTLASDVELELRALGSDVEFSSVVTGGADGTATLTFAGSSETRPHRVSGTSTYRGLTRIESPVEAATTSGSAFGDSTVRINSQLTGSGTINGPARLGLNAMGTLSPGNSTDATDAFIFNDELVLHYGNNAPDATLQFDLAGTTQGIDYDALQVLGDLAFNVDGNDGLAGRPLLEIRVDGGFALPEATEFEIIDLGGTLSVPDDRGLTPAVDLARFQVELDPTGNPGVFTAVDDGDLVGTFGGTDLYITYFGGDGNDIVLYTLADIVLGDLNGDDALTNADIAPFVQALTDPSGYTASFPALNPNDLGDFTGDGVLTNADIAGFVDALTGGASLTAAQQQQLAAVPEPTSLALLGLSALLCVRRRRA